MKNTIFGLGLCAVGLWAADAPADTSLAQQADRQIGSVEKEVVSLAEAMPADKFDFAPTTGAFQGVRTFALQMRHMALVNHELAAALLGEKLPDPQERKRARRAEEQDGNRRVPQGFVHASAQGNNRAGRQEFHGGDQLAIWRQVAARLFGERAGLALLRPLWSGGCVCAYE